MTREELGMLLHGLLSTVDALRVGARVAPHLLLENAAEIMEARESLSDIIAQISRERAA